MIPEFLANYSVDFRIASYTLFVLYMEFAMSSISFEIVWYSNKFEHFRTNV